MVCYKHLKSKIVEVSRGKMPGESTNLKAVIRLYSYQFIISSDSLVHIYICKSTIMHDDIMEFKFKVDDFDQRCNLQKLFSFSIASTRDSKVN